MKAHVILGVIATLLLIGCDSSSTSSSSSSSSSIPPVAETAEGVTLTVVPDTLRECDPPAEVKLSWNASGAGVNAVKIFVVGQDGQEKLFAFYGPEGSQVTGPLTNAKDTLIFKDEGETRQLAKFVIGSEKCG
jgi:hypothetical protein